MQSQVVFLECQKRDFAAFAAAETENGLSALAEISHTSSLISTREMNNVKLNLET